jgi:hypothetical protein
MKQTQVEVLKRVEEILQIRLAGAEFVDIRQHAAEKGWQISDRQLWRYIQKSDAILAESLERDREKLLNRHRAQRFALYARAMSVSDYRTALAVLKDQAQLEGLYPASSQKVTQELTLKTTVTQTERREAIACMRELLAPFPEARQRISEEIQRLLQEQRSTSIETTNGGPP